MHARVFLVTATAEPETPIAARPPRVLRRARQSLGKNVEFWSRYEADPEERAEIGHLL